GRGEGGAVGGRGVGSRGGGVGADIGDGLWSTAPDADIVTTFADAGGTGPRFGQLTVCWATDEEEAVRTAHHWWPNVALEGQLSQDLPTWTHCEQACQLVTPEAVADALPCGPRTRRRG